MSSSPPQQDRILIANDDLKARDTLVDALRESEERYRRLVELSPEAIVVHSDGKFVYLNPAALRLWGATSANQLVGTPVLDRIHPDYRDAIEKRITRIQKLGEPMPAFEAKSVRLDGLIIDVEATGLPFTLDGKPAVQAVIRDITENNKAREALKEAITESSRAASFIRESEQRYRELFENASDIIYTHDLKGNITFLNGAGERITGYSRDEATSMNVADVIAPEYVELAQTMTARKADGSAPTIYELEILTKGGRRVRLEVSTQLIFSKGNPVGVQGIGRDLTERKRSEEVLREVNRITMAIRASLSLSEVLRTATREVGRALSASRVLLHLYNPENPISKVEHEYTAEGVASISAHTITYDSAFGRRLLETQRPIIINDTVNYNDGPPEFSAYVRTYSREAGFRSELDYPLIVKGLFRGVLCIQQTDLARRWSEDELALVEALAERLCIAMGQAELFEMVARGKTEWETTFDAMSDGIFIFDRSKSLKRVNRAGAAMESSHPRELLGRKCCEILHTNSQSEGCAVERAMKENSRVTIEITPERLSRPYLVTIEPISDAQKKPIAVVCTVRDLSELRDVQAVAREHQSLLTNILESARESIYAVDPDGCFKWVNSSTLTGLGYQREEFIGRHLLEMVYEGDRQLVCERLEGALQGQPQTYEMRYFASDGELRYARVDNSPLVVEGKTTGVLGIARDITDRKAERERAARADKLRALGQLASGVAHDFNNSLAAILGRAQLLRRQTTDERMLRNLEIIQTAAEDAAATVRRIQTFARKSLVKEFENVDVRNLLHDAVEITRTRWENEARLRGLEYRVLLDAGSGLITHGNASELREVFVNLIVNAVDAMPNGGRLSLSCVPVGNRLRLQFADNGSGMPEDIQQKIFEPFFTTKGAHGTGLGLSVSYSIIERHEGTISVSSDPGQGTVFTIELPIAKSDFSRVEEPVAQQTSAPLSVLVIDDESAVRETLGDILQALGHQVVLADSGAAGIDELRTHSFDLVFTDLAMPEMDGWETARGIRRFRSDIKIILVTGYGAGTQLPEGEETLVDTVIGKPFDMDQVNDTIIELGVSRNVLEKVEA